MGEIVRRDEVEAAVHAHRELGPDYEDALVDSLVAKIEQRLDARAKAARPARKRVNPMEMALGSLAIAIPVFGIAAWAAGLTGIAVVAVALVALNVFVHLADR